MLQDNFTVQTQKPGPVVPPQPKSIQEQLTSMLLMVDALIKRVMPDGKTLKKDIAVREGKETVSALTTMFSTIMRYQEQLTDMEQGEIFRRAVVTTLAKMDKEQGTGFLVALKKELERLQASSQLLNVKQP